MDELEKIDDLTNKILANLLFKMLPEYQKFYEHENIGNDLNVGGYLFMNEFASFLSSEIIRNPQSTTVSKSFDFINKIGESDNLEVLNIVKIGILEILYTNKNVNREVVFTLLSKKMQKCFQEISKSFF